jgi:hypothetical protein
LYTSDRIARRDRTAIIAYVAVAVLCGVSSFVYAQLSHGVSSLFMTFLGLIPLVGGAGMLGAMRLTRVPPFSRFSFNAYNAAIAAFTVGSALRGVFDIAGTGSPYMPVFASVGAGLLVVAGAAMVFDDVRCLKGASGGAKQSRPLE